MTPQRDLNKHRFKVVSRLFATQRPQRLSRSSRRASFLCLNAGKSDLRTAYTQKGNCICCELTKHQLLCQPGRASQDLLQRPLEVNEAPRDTQPSDPPVKEVQHPPYSSIHFPSMPKEKPLGAGTTPLPVGLHAGLSVLVAP